MSEAREIFDYWRKRCNHPRALLSADRRAKVQARLREGYTVADIKRAIDGAAKAAFVSNGRVFDDLELICRNGSKLEGFISRAQAGRPMRADSLQRADAYLSAPEYEGRR